MTVQFRPRSALSKTTLPPTSTRGCASVVNAIGESQLKRYGSVAGAVLLLRADGETSSACCVRRSQRYTCPVSEFVDVLQTRFGSLGSTSAHMPSPGPTTYQSRFKTPMP